MTTSPIPVETDQPTRQLGARRVTGGADRGLADVADQTDAGRRGRTDIADRVVERIATQSVREVDLASGAPPTLLGRPLGRPAHDAAARATATVDGAIVTIAVTMSVQYPSPVREVATSVRRHVARRVHELTGLDVVAVDVDVSRLVTGQPRRRRVE